MLNHDQHYMTNIRMLMWAISQQVHRIGEALHTLQQRVIKQRTYTAWTILSCKYAQSHGCAWLWLGLQMLC